MMSKPSGSFYPTHEDNFEEVFLSVAAAKTLLIDLLDAVEAVVSGKAFQ